VTVAVRVKFPELEPEVRAVVVLSFCTAWFSTGEVLTLKLVSPP
jgi:hypothetical protein